MRARVKRTLTLLGQVRRPGEVVDLAQLGSRHVRALANSGYLELENRLDDDAAPKAKPARAKKVAATETAHG
jgi:hypothetical protein